MSSCGGDSVDKPGFLKTRNEIFLNQPLNDAAKAVGKGNTKKLVALVEAGLDVNAKGEDGFNLLYWALKSESLRSFEMLLKLGADPDIVWDDNYSVTYWSASLNKDKYLRAVLQYGANPNGLNPQYDDTPLFKSLSADNTTNLELLIKAGADINFQNRHKDTPLMSAASLVRYEFVDFLLKNGADHCIKNSSENNLFYHLDKDEKLLDESSDNYKVVLRLKETLPKCK